MPYRVIDNPAKLTNADWDRVVAVFVMGQVSLLYITRYHMDLKLLLCCLVIGILVHFFLGLLWSVFRS